MSLTMTETELSSPTSTSSSEDLNHRKMEGKANYKKSNKPMMEKKRRARINSSLSQLKSLVLQAMKKDKSQYSKLEKADILELTVRHLKNVQRFQTNSVTQLPDAISKYRAGFNECANEVVRYLGESQGVNDEARTRIISHLASILTPINALPMQHAHTPILPAPLQQVQQQQPQQPHLQQLHLQQLQSQSVFLTPSSQSLSIDTNNNKSVVSQSAFLASAGSTVDMSYLVSGSPTAFQPPMTAGNIVPAGLQLSCIATAAMATTTPLQLVPNTLPSGQVALVLAPHSFPTMNVLSTQQGSRSQVCQETVSIQSQGLARLNDCKSGVAVSDCPVSLVTKPPQSHRQDTAPSAGSYQNYSSSNQTRQSVDHPSNMFSLTPSSQLSNFSLTKSDSLIPSSVSNAAVGITAVSRNSSSIITTNSNNCGTSVVRATSTWRPW